MAIHSCTCHDIAINQCERCNPKSDLKVYSGVAFGADVKPDPVGRRRKCTDPQDPWFGRYK